MKVAKEDLGKFIVRKRGKTMSSRQLALKCNISPAYMSDIERGRRIPKLNVLTSISKNLNLTQEETYYLFDLAAVGSSNRVSYDIVEYIMKNDSLRNCIREAINMGRDDVWDKTLELINRE